MNRLALFSATACLLLAAAGGARGEVSLNCTPSSLSAQSGGTITVDCTIVSTQDLTLRGTQVDFPCSLPRALGTSGTVESIGVTINQAHVDPPYLFGPNGLVITNQFNCLAAGTIGIGQPPVLLPANQPRYLATVTYRASECAFGDFIVQLENFHNPPENADQTKIRAGNNALIAFSTQSTNVQITGGCPCETPANCNDDNQCTDDLCINNVCRNLAADRSCDDGLFCTEDDHCAAGVCVGTGDPCEPQARCNEAQNRCVECNNDAECNDGLFCTGTDLCIANECVYTPQCQAPLLCNENTNVCGECITDLDCEDGNVCTADTCNPILGVCTVVFNTGRCDDGLFCTSQDECADGVCVGKGQPCGDLECDEALDQCLPDNCPNVAFISTNPVSGAVDARQPHPVDSGSKPSRQGIGAANEPIIITLGVSGAALECFTFCETFEDPELGPNAITHVVESEPGVYHIRLGRPITPGGVTTISYVTGEFVSYSAHPANANADSTASSLDIVSLVNYLNGTVTPPYGMLSTDIDHSGVVASPDIIRLIDLLNGAGLYDPWLGTGRPENSNCP